MFVLPFFNKRMCMCCHRRPYNLYCVGADVKPCSVRPPYLLE